jgi:hypothetical protein
MKSKQDTVEGSVPMEIAEDFLVHRVEDIPGYRSSGTSLGTEAENELVPVVLSLIDEPAHRRPGPLAPAPKIVAASPVLLGELAASREARGERVGLVHEQGGEKPDADSPVWPRFVSPALRVTAILRPVRQTGQHQVAEW